MKDLQAEILKDARRFTRYYREDDEYRQHPQLINDTFKARERALKDKAVLFETLSTLRHDEVWAPPLTYFGDFFCRIARRGNGLAADGFLHRVAAEIQRGLWMDFKFRDWAVLSFTYLGFDAASIGLTISAAAFGLESGSPFLHNIYKMFAAALLGHRKWCNVAYTGMTDATNRPLSLREFAVPLTLAEISELPFDAIRRLAAAPRQVPALSCEGRLDGDIYRRILRDAKLGWMGALGSRDVNTAAHWAVPSNLLDASGRPHLTNATKHGIKCAIRLAAWVREHSLREFRQWDALRAVGGTFTLDGGVAEALSILQSHNVISPCGRLTTGRQGRPPSPWYAVNPHWHGKLGGI